MKTVKRFANYRIDEVITDSVMRGYDELLQRPLCIKRIDLACKERLIAFASTLNQRPIEGFAKVYQAGEEEDALYLITEYFESASDLNSAPDIEPRQVVEAIARALKLLHKEGLAYLGLRPDRALVLPDGKIVLSAFGFADVADPLEVLRAKILGQASPSVDAYAFLAPEQKATSGAGPAADWYALGILLYFLHKGEVPDIGSRLSGPDQALFEKLTHPTQALRTFDPDLTTKTKSSLLAPVKKIDVKNPHIEPLSTEMVAIPAGTYLRGSKYGPRDEMPQHTVELSAFAIDVHPVTNEQFLRFLEAMGDIRTAGSSDCIRLKDSRITRTQSGFHIQAGYARHPVVGVTWYGARLYAAWVGKRLPTEAQWEAAAGESTFPTGEEIDKRLANFFNNDTTAVMSYPPGENGLYDMAGNVYEWCEDWYDFHAYDLATGGVKNPSGPVQGVYRSLRGGCWKSLENDLRRTHRHRNNPGAYEATYGFRCVR